MKSPAARPPVLGHAPFVACCVVALAIACTPARVTATTCDPVIGLTNWPYPPFTPAEPHQSMTAEVPFSQ